jgi:hypothetical protein
MINDGFTDSDEYAHPFPASMENWNESWFLSYCDATGDLAGVFRIGLLPNQNRAWLWLMTVAGGHWLVTEDTRLSHGAIRTDTGVEFHERDLLFHYQPQIPLQRALFNASSVSRWTSGPRTGQLATVTVDLTVEASGPCFDNELRIETMSSKGIPDGYSGRRFEQSVRLRGTVTIDGDSLSVDGFGQRDRSWGPRRWSTPFSLGDLNSPDLQLWFAAGADPAAGGIGYTVHDGQLHDIATLTGHLPAQPSTREHASLSFTAPSIGTLTLDIEYLSPPLHFQIAHAQPPYRHYPYYRNLVRGRRDDTGKAMIGWIETLPFAPQGG